MAKIGRLQYFMKSIPLLRRRFQNYQCEDQGLRPTVFYRWKKEFFEGGAVAFERSSSRQTAQWLERIQALEQEITRKNGVIAEVMEELMRCKKKPGDR
jgi:transposase-like protein